MKFQIKLFVRCGNNKKCPLFYIHIRLPGICYKTLIDKCFISIAILVPRTYHTYKNYIVLIEISKFEV